MLEQNGLLRTNFRRGALVSFGGYDARHAAKQTHLCWMTKTMAKAKDFDAAEYLDSPEAIAAYLSEAFKTGDDSLIARALGAL